MYSSPLLEALKSRLVPSPSLDDVSDGIRIAQDIISHSSEENKDGKIFYDLLTLYTHKFDLLHSSPEPDLSAAIAAGEACLDDSEVLPNNRRSWHFNLGTLYYRRYRNTSRKTDIDKPIEHTESVLEDSPQDSP